MAIAWQIGNTTIRNPYRIKDGLKALKESGLAGEKAGQEWDRRYRDELIKTGLLKATQSSDKSNSAGRKWRSAFEKLGFIFPGEKKNEEPIEGTAWTLTPTGIQLIQSNDAIVLEDLFTRALTAPVYEGLEKDTFFSPLFWVISVLNELALLGEKQYIGFGEFKSIVQTTCPPNFSACEVAKKIQEIRKKPIKEKTLIKSVRGIDIEETSLRSLQDYADMNLRYLKATGLFVNYSHGITPNPLKLGVFERFLEEQQYFISDFRQNKTNQCFGFPMFYDNLDEAKKLYIAQVKQAGIQGISSVIPFDIKTVSKDVIKKEYDRLYLKCFEQKEQQFALDQANKWQEISQYMEILIKGQKKETNGLRIPSDMKPAYFEWIIWRSILAIDSLVNSPEQVRKFKIDADFLPIFTAPGGTADLVAEFKDYRLAVEVTLSESSRQEAMEGEPVRRHVADLCQKRDIPTFGLFLARKVHTNTAETFRHGLWYYDDDSPVDLKIVPFSLEEFKNLFDWLFENKIENKAQKLRILLESCLQGKDSLTAPEWKKKMKETIKNQILVSNSL